MSHRNGIAVETNIIACLFLRGEFAARAEEWLRRDRDWVAPVLWRSEFRNLLAGCLRSEQLTFEGMREIQRQALALLIAQSQDSKSSFLARL